MEQARARARRRTVRPTLRRAAASRTGGGRTSAMQLTVIGCGDAFNTGGRGHSCFLVEHEGLRVAFDFGATALLGLAGAGRDPREIDVIVLSHLHGDHFGGIPFLLLDGQFGRRRETPLTIVGPVGTAERLRAAQEVLFPNTSRIGWRFGLEVVELACGGSLRIGPLDLRNWEVVHPSGAPATGLRLQGSQQVLAYSGDTSWTDALVDLASGADLFIVECHDVADDHAPHLSLETLERERTRLGARRILLTHMGDAVLRRMDEIGRRGFLVAHDGLVLDV